MTYKDWNELHKEWDIFCRHPIKEVIEDKDEGYNNQYNRYLEYISMAIIHYSLKTASERLKKGIDWHNSQLKPTNNETAN